MQIIWCSILVGGLLTVASIYGPKAWAETFSYPGAYQSSAFGGGDAPNADHPELAQAENVHVVVGAGPAGANVVDAVNTSDYSVAGIVTNLPAVVGDVVDMRGKRYEWTGKLKSSSLNETGLNNLVNMGGAATSLTSQPFLSVQLVQTAGANFEYALFYRRPNGIVTTILPGVQTETGVSDDAFHDFRLDLTPSTVTGSYDGDGTIENATIASDGAIQFYVDGVLVYDLTGLQFIVNHRGTTDVYDAEWIWHGYTDLPGPVTLQHLSEGDFTPPTPEPYEEPVDVSDPCCGSGSGGAPTQGQTGEIPKVNPYQPHNPGISTTTCVGGGTVPTAADLTDPENWRELLGKTPDVLVELHATKHPATLGETIYRWATKALDLPIRAAFVEGRVRRHAWMEIRRAMALPDQYPEVGRAGVEIDENDALIRTLLDDDSTAYLKGREWFQWLVSSTRRRAGGTMARLFSGIVASFNPGPGRTYRIEAEDQITSPFGVFDQDKLLPQALIDHEFFGPGGDDGTDIHPTRYGGEQAGQLTRGAHKDLIGLPLPILGGICSDRGRTAIDGQSAEKGEVPLIWTRDCYLPGHLDQIFGELLVCLGEVAGIEDVFASDLGYDGPTAADPPRPPKRININATVGRDLFTPADPATWPFATPYRERTVNGKTLCYMAVYLRGPRMTHVREGLISPTANVCGPMGVNGQVIDEVGPFLQWFFNEHAAKDQGRGYRSGAYHTLETSAADPTVPYLQPSSFAAFQAYTEGRIAGGYRVRNFQLRERLTLREVEKRFMEDYEVSFPFNRHGQKKVEWIDDLADPTTGTLYRERLETDEPFPPFVDAHEEVENVVAFRFGFDHDLGEFGREAETIQDEGSIAAHRGAYSAGKRLSDGEPASPLEVYSTSDAPTVRDAKGRRLLRKRKAPRYQEVPTNLFGLGDDIGSQIRLTHRRGVGAGGYVERPFKVLEQRHDPNRHRITHRAMDLSPLMAGAAPALGEKNASDGGFILYDKASFQLPPNGAYELR